MYNSYQSHKSVKRTRKDLFYKQPFKFNEKQKQNFKILKMNEPGTRSI